MSYHLLQLYICIFNFFVDNKFLLKDLPVVQQLDLRDKNTSGMGTGNVSKGPSNVGEVELRRSSRGSWAKGGTEG